MVLLLLLSVVGMMFCVKAILPASLPGDEQLLAQFAEHKGDLEQLQKMLQEDRIVSMPVRDGAVRFLLGREGDRYAPRDPESLPAARRAEYLRLMDKAGVPLGFENGAFVAATEGRHRKAHQVGFVLCPTDPEATFVANLADAGGFSEPHNYYRRIDARWCLIRKGGD
jgi:hypothetical protein